MSPFWSFGQEIYLYVEKLISPPKDCPKKLSEIMLAHSYRLRDLQLVSCIETPIFSKALLNIERE
jgi:hypothetical protein